MRRWKAQPMTLEGRLARDHAMHSLLGIENLAQTLLQDIRHKKLDVEQLELRVVALVDSIDAEYDFWDEPGKSEEPGNY